MKVHVVQTMAGKITVARMPQEAGVSPWAVVEPVDLARMAEWIGVEDADLGELRSEIATDFALHPFHQDQMARSPTAATENTPPGPGVQTT